MERTTQLTASNEDLRREIIGRKRVEAELRRSEGYLAESQRMSRTGSFALSFSAGKLFWSHEHFRIFGLDPETTQPSYSSVLQSVHRDDRPSVQEAFDQAVRSRSGYDLECRSVCPNGMIKHVHKVAHPVFNAAGEVDEFVGTTIDTTERKRAEEALRRTQAELAHVTRVLGLGELTTSIAHEVNQPLAAIVISGQTCLRWLAGESPNLPEARKLVNRIIRDGDRAAEVIRLIRALLKKSDTERTRLEINTIIREAVTLVRGEAHKHRASPRACRCAGLPGPRCAPA